MGLRKAFQAAPSSSNLLSGNRKEEERIMNDERAVRRVRGEVGERVGKKRCASEGPKGIRKWKRNGNNGSKNKGEKRKKSRR